MPAQKRSYETPPQEEQDDSAQEDESRQEQAEDRDDSDSSPSSSGGEKEEFVLVKLSELRKEVQCPICLGIIRKTRTVMECLHRFCRECIDKSMRLGNNECPACRTHCASRRSLRDDPNYDALIAALYPDIDKYEEEELAFHEDEKARNKQIQDSIAQTLQRQSEALGRKRTSARSMATSFARRSHVNYRNLRGRRNHRAAERELSDEEDSSGHDEGKDSSSSDEHFTDVKPKRYKRWGGARCSQPSSAADGGCDGNDSEVNKEPVGAVAGLVGGSEMLAWGRGGMRSSNRHGMSVGNGKYSRNSRVSKLIGYLRNSEENDDELDIYLMLVSLDKQRIPSLQRPYLCCRSSSSVRHLCQHIALQTSVPADEVEMLLAKEHHSEHTIFSISEDIIIDPSKSELELLQNDETLAGLQAKFNLSQHHLVLVYRQKLSGSGNS